MQVVRPERQSGERFRLPRKPAWENESSVVLPDSGTRYLSKIYSDEWMRDWGFLDDRPDLGSVQKMLDRRGTVQIFSAAPEDSLHAVIEKMKQHDISQLPVLENGELIGLIRESDLLGMLVSGKHTPSSPIKSAIVKEYYTITPQAPVSRLAEMFFKNSCDVVFAVDNQKLVGILTKIDLIDYLAGAQS